jgi:hypothetical protein
MQIRKLLILESTIFNLYYVVAILMSIGIVLSFINWLWTEEIKRKEEDLLLPALVSLEGSTIKNLTLGSCNTLNNYFNHIFGEPLISHKVFKKVSLLVLIITVLAFVSGRIFSGHSFIDAVLAIFSGGGLTYVAITLIVVNIIFANISLMITRKFIRKSTSVASSPRAVFWIISDMLIGYLLVSVSLYTVSILFSVVPALIKSEFKAAIDMAITLSGFMHTNALNWLNSSVTMIDGVSTTIYSLISFIPSVMFIGLVSSAIMSYWCMNILRSLFLKLTKKIVLGEKSALITLSIGLLAVAGLIAAWGKTLELLQPAA